VNRLPVGVLPAAGEGSRLRPFRYPKELLPIAYEPDVAGSAVRPRAVIEFSLSAMVRAGVPRCVLIVAPSKLDILSYVGDGEDLGISMSYVCQDRPCGMAAAVDLAYPWTAEATVVMAMPDTVIQPADFLATTLGHHDAWAADLTLAVFPTGEPHRLGPVVHEDGVVLAVEDKPERPRAANTWGAAVWNPVFSDLLHAAVSAADPTAQVLLGDCFQAAVDKGLCVRAVEFPDGRFLDIGTPQGLGALLLPAVGGPS
jgi:glucose-1-phosphate thymidylyltransferase